MAFYTPYIKRFYNFDGKTLWVDWFGKKDPRYFKPMGTQIYHGYQGEGKTISMYHHGTTLHQRYPDAVIVTNLHLSHMEAITPKSQADLVQIMSSLDTRKQYLSFETYEQLILLLRYVRNGDFGVIYMIDEIHNYFHSHDSKSMPMWIVQVFSQQRKQHLVVLGTVQDWEDVIKALRRQVDNLIKCHRRGHFIFNEAIDPRTFEVQYGERSAPIRKKGFFFVSRAIREGFDTYQVINSGREILGGSDLNISATFSEPQKTGRFSGRRLR